MRAIRLDRGLTVRQIATAAGISAGYLSRVERGLRGETGVSDEAVSAIAAALSMPLEAIISASEAAA